MSTSAIQFSCDNKQPTLSFPPSESFYELAEKIILHSFRNKVILLEYRRYSTIPRLRRLIFITVSFQSGHVSKNYLKSLARNRALQRFHRAMESSDIGDRRQSFLLH